MPQGYLAGVVAPQGESGDQASCGDFTAVKEFFDSLRDVFFSAGGKTDQSVAPFKDR